jgi:transcriptional regulator with XRE-family HTH domain
MVQSQPSVTRRPRRVHPRGPKRAAVGDVVDQERALQELIRSLPPAVLGARLARVRRRLGLTVRQLAAAANVNKNSIVRLEKGGPPQALTVAKVCAALGVHATDVADPRRRENELVAVHRRRDDRWYDLTDFGAGPLKSRPLSSAERWELASRGHATPMLLLKSRLEGGRLMPNLIELFGESARRSHAGEELVYVLEGVARISVGPEVVELSAGECAAFWSAEEHAYAPAEGSPLPVRLLSVSLLDARAENVPKRRQRVQVRR